MSQSTVQNKIRKNSNSILCQNHNKLSGAVLTIILISSGDIELNPGPKHNSIYPCGACERKVDWSCRAIACDGCNVWYHQSCISMTSSKYNHHVDHESAVWICIGCDSVNYCNSFTYHSLEIDKSQNRFSLLDNSRKSKSQSPSSTDTMMKDYSIHSPESVFNPRHTSSPTIARSPKTSSCSSDLDENVQLDLVPKRGNNLRVMNFNAQSLRGKLAEFKYVLEYCSPDVVSITETWLFGKKPGKNPEKHYISDSELDFKNYNLFRNDRNEDGGGVLLMVKKNIVATEETRYVTDCEINWVTIKVKGSKDVLIGSFYMPHRNEKDLDNLKESLTRISNRSHRHVILCGDFNCPDINWENGTLNQNAKEDKVLQNYLADLTSEFSLHQVVRETTRYANVLDLIFTSNPSLAKSTNIIPGISDHDFVMTDLNIRPHYQQFKKRSVLLYHKANWDKIKHECIKISTELRSASSQNASPDLLWDMLKGKLQETISENVPSKNITNRNSVPWMNQHLKKLIRKKSKLHKKAKETNNWKKYKELQKYIKKSFKDAEKDFINEKIQEGLANNNSKPLWRYIKAKKQDNVGISPIMDQGKLKTNDSEIAESLLRQFCSVFTKPEPDPNLNLVKQCEETLTKISIDSNGVEKLLKGIKPEKASGPDSLPNRVLKECAHELSPGITALFQKSLDTGLLPPDWTNALIAPVFKKGDRQKAENYRPVSLTCVISKVLEHIVCSNMTRHLERNKILTNLNHGFRRGYSCETQLAVTLNDIAQNHDNDIQTDVAILDFSKAFDTVPHQKLLLKLESYGIGGQLLSWIENFLCHRKMSVIVNGEKSQEAKVLSGVPQGTVLGPLLFLCHINDLPDSVRSTVRLFADDCLLYRHIKTSSDHLILQNDLKNLENWAKKWGMTFNPKKCYILSVAPKTKSNFFYQLNDTILQEVENSPYLGITISNDLSWEKHITAICHRANATLGFIRRNLYHCPKETRRLAYLSLVRSTLEYGSIIWDPHLQKDIVRIEKVQRKAARFITGDYRSRNPGCVTKMLEDLCLPSLERRRQEMRLTFLYKIVEGHLPAIPPNEYLKPLANKRKIKAKNFNDCISTNIVMKYENSNNRCFKIPSSEKPNGPFSNSFFCKTIADWNKLGDNIVQAGSIEKFKDLLARSRS